MVINAIKKIKIKTVTKHMNSFINIDYFKYLLLSKNWLYLINIILKTFILINRS